VAEANPLVMKKPAPRARLRTFNDSSIDFELLVWAKRPQDRGKITHEINKQIYLRFADEEVNIPFPQRVVHVVGEAQQSQDISLEENNT
jgi:MscS family membrane protein